MFAMIGIKVEDYKQLKERKEATGQPMSFMMSQALQEWFSKNPVQKKHKKPK